MRTFGAAMAALSAAFLVAGLAWPHLADRLIHILLASLAMSYVGARALRSGFPSAVSADTFSPFDARSPDRPLPSHPPAIRKLATVLGAADDRESADRAPIPAVAQRIVAAEAARRLADHRGLHVHVATDHARIRAIVSEATWSLIRPETDPAQAHENHDPVPLSHLDPVLDDLERL